LTEKSREYKVDYLARVEGEGALYVKVRDGEVVDVKFKIFESPRLFEAFLLGRMYYEVPDITARICGICPIAYMMSSTHAIEQILGVSVEGPLRQLRRLIYCGEWIESHMLHAFLLHLPDFLGYDDAMQMAKYHHDLVKKALRVKKIGNDLVALIGGREVHPINVCVGGFYKTPTRDKLSNMKDELKQGKELTKELIMWLSKLDFPDFEQDYEFVSLKHPNEYPMNEGRIVSNKGLDIAVNQFEEYIIEEQVPHSTALHTYIKGRGSYMVGPLARVNLNRNMLHDESKELLKQVGFPEQCNNPFMSIIARVAETLYAFEESLSIIDVYTEPDRPRVEVVAREGRGCACTEAPRGILYHRYDLSPEGTVISAKIIPPTAQNQKRIEDDLRTIAPSIIKLPHSKAVWRFEQAIRNYDPCISCATHFLRLQVDEE
jgi:sulfhydrogenase subunit alpha